MDMWVGFVLIGWCLLLLVPNACSSTGTTSNIKERFIGRCWDYLEPGRYQRQSQLNPPSITNCSELWSLFSEAWVRKDPETVTEQDYLPFFNAAKEQDIEKLLLWSGAYGVAHKYSSNVLDYVTLEDTLVGTVVNGLNWCGNACSQCPGINYTSCPDYRQNEAMGAFWIGASKSFASSLKEKGLVQLMLNGSNPVKPAFRESSYANTYELPNLPKTASIRIILMHGIERTPTEYCDTGSLVTLKERLVSLNFTFECIENPPAVVHLLCADVPLKRECLFQFEAMINSGTNSVTSVLKYICPFLMLIVFTSL